MFHEGRHRLSSHLAPAVVGLFPRTPVAGISHTPRRRMGRVPKCDSLGAKRRCASGRLGTRSAGKHPQRRHGPGTWATLPLWDVALPFAMFLAQSDKSQGVGDRVPKGHGSTQESDEPFTGYVAIRYSILGLIDVSDASF